MSTGAWIAAILAVLSLGLVAFGSASEAGLGALLARRDRRIQEELGAGRSRLGALAHPHIAMSAAIIVTTLATCAVAACLTWIGTRIGSGSASPWPEIAAGLIAGLAVLILGEIVPRTLALRDPERTAMALAGPLSLLTWSLRPIILALRVIGRAFGPRVGYPGVATESELPFLPQPGESRFTPDAPETEMIAGIIDLEETTVREVMVPRIDIAGIPMDAPLEAAADLVIARGFSRIPAYRDSIDDIVGVVYAKDILRYLRSRRTDVRLSEIARPPYFIPESKHVNDLLHDLQQKRIHIAIVVDEYGGTAGLITIEDLLEEIVGEIQDEYDTETPLVEHVNANEIVLDGRADLDTLAELTQEPVENEAYDTVGGLLYHHLGRVPLIGDRIQVGDFELSVESTIGKRVGRLRLRRKATAETDGTSP